MNWSFLLLMAYDQDGSSNGQFCLFGTSWGKGHRVICKVEALSSWWFQRFLIFTPNPAKDPQFD